MRLDGIAIRHLEDDGPGFSVRRISESLTTFRLILTFGHAARIAMALSGLSIRSG